MDETLLKAIKIFSQEENPKICACPHELQGTGVFYQSVLLIQCITCNGWQKVRKPIR